MFHYKIIASVLSFILVLQGSLLCTNSKGEKINSSDKPKWTGLSSMLNARMECASVAINKKIYVFGGGGGKPWVSIRKTEVYDIVKDKWKELTNAPENIYKAVATNDKVYAMGASTLYEYDIIKDKWKEKSKMSVAREQYSMAAVNERIYFIGGKFGDGYIVEEYDIKTDKWTKKKNKDLPSRNACAVVYKGKIYLIGGHDLSGRNAVNRVEVYDPVKDQWTQKAGMANTRTDFAAAGINGKVYAIGGWSESVITGMIEEYDIANDKWNSAGNLSPARSMHSAVSFNNKIYVVGGTKDYTTTLNNLDRYY